MCKIVFVKGAERTHDCATRGELASAIGGQPVFIPGSGASEGDCLCRLDPEKTAQAHGLELLSKSDDWVLHFTIPTKG